MTMDEHTLAQMVAGVSNKGLPPGCYINSGGVAEKKRRNRLDQIERRLSRLEDQINMTEENIK